METILERIKDVADKHVQILSQILKVNVEIIDENFKVISTTEEAYENNINEADIYRSVLVTGEKKVITNPGEDSLCKRCPRKDVCVDTFEMHTPIRLDNRIIGVMCFSCADESQKQYILDNFDTLSEFIDQISDLIALKAKETLENDSILQFMQVLNNVINKVEQGIIITNRDGRILKANNRAIKLLGLGPAFLEEGITAHIQPGVNQNQYRVSAGGRSRIFIGELHRLSGLGGEYSGVFMFSAIEDFNRRVVKAINTRENVGLKDILGSSGKMEELKRNVKKIAASTSTVLITGPSGTGKELFARAIHMESTKGDQPFVAINCAAIPDTLLESELFGYVKGAFTGADPKGKVGKIELANNGVLFLDEIGDMPLYIQAKVLRAIELQEIVRLGANDPIYVNVRFIAATNKDLQKLMRERMFREDLFYRLNVIPLAIPALKERKEDIPVLTRFFVKKYSHLFHKPAPEVEEEVWECLRRYDWPGNVRELENTVEYMINMAEEGRPLSLELLPRAVTEAVPASKARAASGPSACASGSSGISGDFGAWTGGSGPFDWEGFSEARDGGLSTIEEMERRLIQRALEQYGTGWNEKQEIARTLGVGVATLYRKIKKYGLDREEQRP